MTRRSVPLVLFLVLATGSMACATAPPSDSPAPTALVEAPSSSGTAQDDVFRLTIESPRTRYDVNEAIPIAAVLEYVGAAPVHDVTASGGGIVAFSIEHLDGAIDVEPARTADCMPYRFVVGQREELPFQKSGGFSADDPMADFWRRFFAEPELRLPAGRYRISAIAEYAGPDCDGGRTLSAPLLLVVG